jgi:hypothetical protein
LVYPAGATVSLISFILMNYGNFWFLSTRGWSQVRASGGLCGARFVQARHAPLVGRSGCICVS